MPNAQKFNRIFINEDVKNLKNFTLQNDIKNLNFQMPKTILKNILIQFS